MFLCFVPLVGVLVFLIDLEQLFLSDIIFDVKLYSIKNMKPLKISKPGPELKSSRTKTLGSELQKKIQIGNCRNEMIKNEGSIFGRTKIMASPFPGS